MPYRYAKKLHNGDQATLKATGETIAVLNAWEEKAWDKKYIVIEGVGDQSGYGRWTHVEIK